MKREEADPASEERAQDREEAFENVIVAWAKEHPDQFWFHVALRLFAAHARATDPKDPSSCHFLLDWNDFTSASERLEIDMAPRQLRSGKLVIELWMEKLEPGKALLHHGPLQEFDREPD